MSIQLGWDQDLTMFMREVEDVVREIMEDSRFNGHQHYKFEAEFDENGELLFGGEASAGVSFQIGQIRYILCIYQINKVYILYILCILQVSLHNHTMNSWLFISYIEFIVTWQWIHSAMNSWYEFIVLWIYSYYEVMVYIHILEIAMWISIMTNS